MNDALKKLLEAVGVAPPEAIEKLKEIAARVPEGAAREAEIEALINSYALPALADLPNTVAGIAKDISSGMTGVDPEAWSTSI